MQVQKTLLYDPSLEEGPLCLCDMKSTAKCSTTLDTTKFEWLTNQHRDTYSSYIGHPNLLCYFAVAENESVGRMKFNFLGVGQKVWFALPLDAVLHLTCELENVGPLWIAT